MTKSKSLIGYTPYISNQSLGFVAPVFSLGSVIFTETEGLFPHSPNLFISVYERDLIRISSDFCEISSPDLNYGVLFDPETLAVGSKKYIKHVIETHGEHLFDDSAIALQISEIFGSYSEKTLSRNRFSKDISNCFSQESAFRFRNDAISRSTLWEHISKRMILNEDLGFLGSLRKLAVRNADFHLENLFPEFIWDKLSPHLSIDRDKFITEFQSEVHLDEDEGDQKDYQEYYHNILREVSKYGRQEQRVGKVLAEFVKNPELATRFLRQYRDRGQFANEALGRFEREIYKDRLLPTEAEYLVAGFVAKLYTLAFPMQRGMLLYDLACTLRDSGAAAEAVRLRTDKSGSIYVIDARAAIYDVLDGRDTGSLGGLFQ
jgi:hypothetical protein